MTTAILAILAALIPLIAWLIRRHLTHEDDPYTEHTEKREQIAKEILRNDEDSANRTLDADLDKLRGLNEANEKFKSKN
jgi:uncharacterized protein with ATP-grasp and redox domains